MTTELGLLVDAKIFVTREIFEEVIIGILFD